MNSTLIALLLALTADFDVASIKPSQAARVGGEGSGRESVSVTPSTVALRNASLSFFIQWAYSVRSYQISGPDWIRWSRYDLVAKTETPLGSERQLKEMTQALLADRFRLRLRRATRTIPVYQLTAGSGAAKLRHSATDEHSGMNVANGSFVFEHVTMSQLAENLSDLSAFDRPVVNTTGLDGAFDSTLPSAAAAMRENPDSIFSALESIGLSLSARKSPVEILIVDHAEQPSQN
jgi:uncharacterized protein (TIGR03435 family)